MSLSGTVLMAVRAARGASAFTAFRLAVRAFPAPYLHLFFLGALDASLTHLPVVLNLGFRKFSVLPEDDVEAETEDAECYKKQSGKKYLHISQINNIPSERVSVRRNIYQFQFLVDEA